MLAGGLPRSVHDWSQPLGPGRDQQGFTAPAGAFSQLREHFKRARMTGLLARLDRLRQWRELCDYQDGINNFAALADCARAEADAVIDDLSQPQIRAEGQSSEA